MKLITTKSQILDAIDICKSSLSAIERSEQKKEILKELDLADFSKATQQDIYKIFGHDIGKYFRSQACSECGAKCDALVEAGEPLDYESFTARLCEKCLNDAANLIFDYGLRGRTL